MRESLVGVVLLLAGLLQVTAAPLFPLGGAISDIGLISLTIIAVFLGPRWAMVCLPLLALLLGALTSHQPATFILAYLPLLPLAAWLSGSPLNRFTQTLVTGLATGLWARSLVATATMLTGAEADIAGLVSFVLLPGLVFDFALLTSAYAVCRVIGWEPQSLSLRGRGYFTS